MKSEKICSSCGEFKEEDTYATEDFRGYTVTWCKNCVNSKQDDKKVN